jgi:nitrite reductase [NAD(P)H] small subunit
MTDCRWIRIAVAADLPPREGRVVQLGSREIAVFNLGDRFFAADNRCPHKGGPLCDGIMTGHAVVCPLHAWKVNLETGEVERPAAANRCVQTYPTRVQDGVLLVDVRGFGLQAERSMADGAIA